MSGYFLIITHCGSNAMFKKKRKRLKEADWGTTTLLSALQPVNAIDWILLTLLGIDTLFNFLQSLNVNRRIFVIPSGIMIDVRFTQLLNASAPI